MERERVRRIVREELDRALREAGGDDLERESEREHRSHWGISWHARPGRDNPPTPGRLWHVRSGWWPKAGSGFWGTREEAVRAFKAQVKPGGQEEGIVIDRVRDLDARDYPGD